MFDHDNEVRKKGNKNYTRDKIKPQQIHQHTVHFPLTGIPPCTLLTIDQTRLREPVIYETSTAHLF